MKKLLYTLTVLVALSVAVSSCTEENVKPKTEAGNEGGNASTDKEW
ncbi:MAG: hypothetical protein ACOYXA_16300 [Bacteroidota bacterium]